MLKLKTVSKNTNTTVAFDFHTPINMEFGNTYADNECIHCYEISDARDKSLLEIAIGATSGNLKYITLIIPPHICTEKQQIDNAIINKFFGLPSFEIKNLAKNDFHTNVKIDFNVCVNTNSILFMLLPNKITIKIFTDRVIFGFDASNTLCSIEIINVTKSERELFEESLKAKGTL